MEYNIGNSGPRQRVSDIGYTVDNDMFMAKMPRDLLASKFEETDLGDESGLYDDYVRGEIKDFRPDKSRFEHEEIRRPTGMSGMLDLRTTGHRGTADYERPEMFLGFGGREDWDPRGTALDPDFKKLEAQHRSRMRFERFTDQNAESQITGGGRSEPKAIEDNKKIREVERARMKFFDRQLGCKANGMRRDFANVSDASKQVTVQSYGDLIEDYALNPQRSALRICERTLDSAGWRCFTNDQDMAIAKYTQVCSQKKQEQEHKLRNYDADSEFRSQDMSNCYKTAAILMDNITRNKRTMKETMANGDIDMQASAQSIAMKTAPMVNDLQVITASIASADFATGDDSLLVSTKAPQMQRHAMRTTDHDTITPAHHYLNVEQIRKGIQMGKDVGKIKASVVYDGKTQYINDISMLKKQSKMKRVTGAHLPIIGDQEAASPMVVTYSYKTRTKRNISTAQFSQNHDSNPHESDRTQNRTINHAEVAGTGGDHVADGRFSDNTVKERLGGRLGKKYLRNAMDTDDMRTTGVFG